MFGPFRPPARSAERQADPQLGAIVGARAFARDYLVNTCVVWGGLVALALLVLGAAAAGWPPPKGSPAPVAVPVAVVVQAFAVIRGGRALGNLLDEPVAFEGRVEEKAAPATWRRLAVFLKDQHSSASGGERGCAR